MKYNMIHPQILEMDLNQIEGQVDSWKQLLNLWMEENIVQKNMLSEILKNNYDQNSLEEIEDFQSRFISDDELISSLKKNIYELVNLLPHWQTDNDKMDQLLISKWANLENDISNSGIKLQSLKSAFDDFQHKILANRGN